MKPLLGIVAFVFLNFIAAIAWTSPLSSQAASTPSSTDNTLIATPFSQLPGWLQDQHSKAFTAFQLSCQEVSKRPTKSTIQLLPTQIGFAANWQPACRAAMQVKSLSDRAARLFFENWFTPYAVMNADGQPNGLFTGYYLPLIKVSTHPSAQYSIPIYGIPSDLVKVDLGLFPINLAGKSIAGKVQHGQLIPYPDRAAIVSGAIKQEAPVIAWTNNWIDLFFAQVQGSAIIQFPNHSQQLIGYAGSNGHPYTSIAKILIAENQLDPKSISMKTLRDWLSQHPKQLHHVLNTDASYVFFKNLPFTAPLGTQQIPLTANRSLAIDQHYLIMGMPIWLQTNLPANHGGLKPFEHLMISQDTGGAIKGIVRGDIYFGAGEEAEWLAGNMQNQGKYWVLLPKKQENQ